jgi:DNA-binding GntR family transcriptional regulator
MVDQNPMPDALFEPAERNVYSTQVEAKLRAAIVDGRLPIGKPLRERQIADDLELSRAPVREALRSLEKEGLVVTVPHRGTYVATYTDRDVEEIYSLRATLESLAFVRATNRVTATELRSLDSLVGRMDRLATGSNFQELIKTDLAFHRRICELADHGRLLETWEQLARQIMVLYTVTDVPELVKRLYGYVEEIGDRHRPIVTALRDRDIEGGRAYIATHVLEVAHIIAEQGAVQQRSPVRTLSRGGARVVEGV